MAESKQPAKRKRGQEAVNPPLHKAIREVLAWVSEMADKKELLEKLETWAKERNSIERERVAVERYKVETSKELEEKRIERWYTTLTKTFICRVGLAALVISAVTALGFAGKIEPTVLATLLTASVASLFIPPKRD